MKKHFLTGWMDVSISPPQSVLQLQQTDDDGQQQQWTKSKTPKIFSHALYLQSFDGPVLSPLFPGRSSLFKSRPINYHRQLQWFRRDPIRERSRQFYCSSARFVVATKDTSSSPPCVNPFCFFDSGTVFVPQKSYRSSIILVIHCPPVLKSSGLSCFPVLSFPDCFPFVLR